MADERSTDTGLDPERPESAEILAPGPILGVVALAVGWGIDVFVPIGGLPSPAKYVLGGTATLAGVVVVASSVREMGRIDKSPDHGDEPSELLTEGPFAYSRNPIYIGIIVAYLGLTIIIGSLWPLLTLIPLAWYFDRMARREEDYLEATFGEEFREYRSEVRRWL